MALIDKFEPVSGDAQRVHGPVTCGYRSFAVNGKKVVQLDTYGSPERQIQGKISQSVQLDLEAARQLINILKGAFPELA